MPELHGAQGDPLDRAPELAGVDVFAHSEGVVRHEEDARDDILDESASPTIPKPASSGPMSTPTAESTISAVIAIVAPNDSSRTMGSTVVSRVCTSGSPSSSLPG